MVKISSQKHLYTKLKRTYLRILTLKTHFPVHIQLELFLTIWKKGFPKIEEEIITCFQGQQSIGMVIHYNSLKKKLFCPSDTNYVILYKELTLIT